MPLVASIQQTVVVVDHLVVQPLILCQREVVLERNGNFEQRRRMRRHLIGTVRVRVGITWLATRLNSSSVRLIKGSIRWRYQGLAARKFLLGHFIVTLVVTLAIRYIIISALLLTSILRGVFGSHHTS